MRLRKTAHNITSELDKRMAENGLGEKEHSKFSKYDIIYDLNISVFLKF